MLEELEVIFEKPFDEQRVEQFYEYLCGIDDVDELREVSQYVGGVSRGYFTNNFFSWLPGSDRREEATCEFPDLAEKAQRIVTAVDEIIAELDVDHGSIYTRIRGNPSYGTIPHNEFATASEQRSLVSQIMTAIVVGTAMRDLHPVYEKMLERGFTKDEIWR